MLAATRWQIVLHSDVFAQQQQVCPTARHREEAATVCAFMVEEHVDLVAGDFNGAAAPPLR